MNYEENSLTLGLGFTPPTLKPTPSTPEPSQLKVVFSDEPSLTLSLAGIRGDKAVGEDPPCSAASSVSVKRERESASSDEVDVGERVGFCRGSDEDEDGACHVTPIRKKLRLTKHQSAMLEESFKLQSTLNPKQKQALAERLNLRPRQVEVWFQNRRARTKLKQTEVDCEYLKKYCETLSEENRRLEKEVQELKALKLTHPFYNSGLPAATLTMCPSCERIGAGVGVGVNVPSVSKSAFTLAPKTHRLFSSPPNRPLLVDN
ncbi:hypothetical protein RND81_13G170700 [Saponaria officinalis]|uniref:Homeobox domain-containing protein n=1 Tax=Saponaria officinalis TaxID=3572 RepID=A0AAW1H4P0_SAPOF